jgi:hypothetical protein
VKSFDEWLPTFIAFRTRCREVLGQRLPTETVKLQEEYHLLPELLFHAHDFAADAIGFYYQAKNKNMDKLLEEGWPKSALDSAGKALSFKELWAREQAERIAETIT